MSYQKVSFQNNKGVKLAGKIEFPVDQVPLAYVIFVHVFTGHKNLIAAKYISKALRNNGFAVLRFDFTGLGDSEGDFSETNFSSNIEDIHAAHDFLVENYKAPSILVGQSLGGASSLFAAHNLESIKAVAMIGTPSEPEHVMHLLGCKLEDIIKRGFAEVTIGGRRFTIKKHFVDDLYNKKMLDKIKALRKAILIMHSPQDEIVEIENAAKIYQAAHHPKSFVTLDGADHMLSEANDAHYAGEVISSWVKRYINIGEKEVLKTSRQVIARLDDDDTYTTEIKAGLHSLTADEPKQVGGNAFGPTPYELLLSALAACKAMTMQMYARRKKWDLQSVKVHISYDKNYKEDCEDCIESDKKIDLFSSELEFEGNLDAKQKERLKEIANKCPVHRTLAGNPEFVSKLIS